MASDQRAAAAAKDQAPIDQRFDQTAEDFSTALIELLGDDVRVTVGQIDQPVYGEFVLGTDDTASFCALMTTPDVGQLLLQLPRRILGLVLDRMLGAVRQVGTLATLPLTDIESRLIAKFVSRFNTSLQDAWRDVMPFQIVLEQATTDVRQLRLLPVDSETIVVTFQMELGGAMAEMKLLVPGDWQQRIAAVQKAITGQGGQAPGAAAATSGEDGASTIELVARLAETEISAEDLAGLNVGDIITTEKDVGDPLDLTIGGEVKYHANLGKVGDKKAVRIVEDVKKEEP